MTELLMHIWSMLLETAVEFLVILIIAVAVCMLWLTVSSKRLKTVTKTAVYFLASALLTCFVSWLSRNCAQAENVAGAIACGITAAAMGVIFLVTGIHGHKNGWKQN